LYIQALKIIQKPLRRVQTKNVVEIFLQHENERPHTSLKTRKAIRQFGWNLLAHSQHSPHLAPSHFHFCVAHRNINDGKRFGSEDEVVEEEK
jgi:hypothetical protein